jgi:hypothetical protein
MPEKNQTPEQLLGYERDPKEAKFAYIRLNIPQLVRLGLFSRSTQGWVWKFLSLHHIRFAFGQGCDCPAMSSPSIVLFVPSATPKLFRQHWLSHRKSHRQPGWKRERSRL